MAYFICSYVQSHFNTLSLPLKMNGYTSRGSSSAITTFSSLFSEGQLIKERICSSRSKVFLLRVDPFVEELHLGKQTGSLKKLSPFVKLPYLASSNFNVLGSSDAALFSDMFSWKTR